MAYNKKMEQETILIYDQYDRIAHLTTSDKKLAAIWSKAAKEYPDIIDARGKASNGDMEYYIPCEHLSINFIKPISEERRKQLSESGKMGWEKANSSQGSAN